MSATTQNLAWKRLQKLRQSYLTAQGFLADYWSDDELLEAYDETLAQRIRWKWRAVWEALPQVALPETLVDLACGTGAASREILLQSPGRFKKVVLLDRSTRAVRFAADKIRTEFPYVKVETQLAQGESYFLLVSHVFSELPEDAMGTFRVYLSNAEAFLWLESGRHQESRRLSRLREDMKPSHQILAPCPHQALCGMLKEGQEANWCHFRAEVPREVHQSAFWREASKQLGIDLRALPVAYLFGKSGITQRKDEPSKAQILAGSKSYKGYVRYHACHESQVFVADFMKRHSKEIYASLEEPAIDLRYSLSDLGKEDRNGSL